MLISLSELYKIKKYFLQTLFFAVWNNLNVLIIIYFNQ